jgi:type III secretion protein U
MSGTKTEKPTPKRLKDEAKKGKAFNSRDLTAAAVLWAGVFALTFATSFKPLMVLYTDVVRNGFSISPMAAVSSALHAFARAVAPITLVSILCTVLVSLLMSKGVIASEAQRIDINRLNPVNGFKNLFSLKVVKDLLRALLYLLFAGLFVWLAWKLQAHVLFSQIHGADGQIAVLWLRLSFSICIGLMLALAPVYLLAGWVDHVLYTRELKMEKHEVKREHKDNEISQVVKQRRREISDELSAQVQADTQGSTLVLANPTHVAVGIYVHDASIPMPFVSVREKGARARKVIALAERSGVPVVRDIKLARAVYAKCRRYRFVHDDDIDRIMAIVQWLKDVERAAAEPDEPDEPDEPTPLSN